MPTAPSPSSPRPVPGLFCTVLRPSAGEDATLGGISATSTGIVLTDPLRLCDFALLTTPASGADERETIHEAEGPARELQLRERRGFLIACPPDADRRGEPYAFGGNWIWTPDPCFPEPHPIAIHDRDLRREERSPGEVRHAVTNLVLDPPMEVRGLPDVAPTRDRAWDRLKPEVLRQLVDLAAAATPGPRYVQRSTYFDSTAPRLAVYGGAHEYIGDVGYRTASDPADSPEPNANAELLAFFDPDMVRLFVHLCAAAITEPGPASRSDP